MFARVGIFGGTFDPPHVGHLVAACAASDQLALDRVLLVVAGTPWQKQARPDLSPAATRLALVQAAVDGHPQLEASDVEVRREGPSYTIDTLVELAAARPDDRFVVVLGADAAAGVPTWHRAAEVIERASFAVVERDGVPAAALRGLGDVAHVTMPRLDVSSSEVRARCREGRSIEFLVPDGVWSMIRRLHLYGLEA